MAAKAFLGEREGDGDGDSVRDDRANDGAELILRDVGEVVEDDREFRGRFAE